MAERIEVFVAEDHPLFRSALTDAIKARAELRLVGTADNGRSALEEIPQRISEAFALVADRVPAIQQDLAELAGALGPASGGSAQEPGDRQARLAG